MLLRQIPNRVIFHTTALEFPMIVVCNLALVFHGPTTDDTNIKRHNSHQFIFMIFSCILQNTQGCLRLLQLIIDTTKKIRTLK